jgi:hypothetical protein
LNSPMSVTALGSRWSIPGRGSLHNDGSRQRMPVRPTQYTSNWQPAPPGGIRETGGAGKVLGGEARRGCGAGGTPFRGRRG